MFCFLCLLFRVSVCTEQGDIDHGYDDVKHIYNIYIYIYIVIYIVIYNTILSVYNIYILQKQNVSVVMRQ